MVIQRLGQQIAGYAGLWWHDKKITNYRITGEQSVNTGCLSYQLNGGRPQLPDKSFTVGGYE